MRQLTIEGFLFFKLFTISKVLHLALVKDVPSSAISQLEKNAKAIYLEKRKSKLKHTTLYNEYEQGGPKDVNIFSKIASLQGPWVKKLYDDSFDAWKETLLFLIKNQLGKKFVFQLKYKAKCC